MLSWGLIQLFCELINTKSLGDRKLEFVRYLIANEGQMWVPYGCLSYKTWNRKEQHDHQKSVITVFGLCGWCRKLAYYPSIEKIQSWMPAITSNYITKTCLYNDKGCSEGWIDLSTQCPVGYWCNLIVHYVKVYILFWWLMCTKMF